jgi:SAM-dependent methyltransferase
MSGVGRVVRFNWPSYAVALAAIAVGMAIPLPDPLGVPVRDATFLGAAWIVAGLAATWCAYDRSPLYRWHWLLALLPAAPARYAVVSTGLDEIGPSLRQMLPDATGTLLDLYDPAITRTGSIRRARALVPPPPGGTPARPSALPVPDGRLDAVFAVFAAHELRTAGQRAALFGEVARVLRPAGRLLLVEHCRDAANLAAYGPGAWHFYSRREWLRLAGGAGLTPAGETTVTPLVRVLVFAR